MEPKLTPRLEDTRWGAAAEARPDGGWTTAEPGDLPALAQTLLASGARLSTITARALEDGESELIYHFVAGSSPLNVRTRTLGNRIESIAPVLPAANWIEREIHDLFLVEFTGHPNLAPLLLPKQVPAGLFRQPGGAAGKAQVAKAQVPETTSAGGC